MKITDKDQALIDAGRWQEVIHKLNPRTRELLLEEVSCLAFMLFDALNECESPIEELMAIALYQMESTWGDIEYLEVQKQVRINCDGHRYRVDFFVTGSNSLSTKTVDLVVECDGHDFHEKTKIQAARDKRRDRILAKHGYTVLRFTGSEIWREGGPSSCAMEVYNTMRSLLNR